MTPSSCQLHFAFTCHQCMCACTHACNQSAPLPFTNDMTLRCLLLWVETLVTQLISTIYQSAPCTSQHNVPVSTLCTSLSQHNLPVSTIYQSVPFTTQHHLPLSIIYQSPLVHNLPAIIIYQSVPFTNQHHLPVQFKMVSMRSGKPILCAPPRLSGVPPTLPNYQSAPFASQHHLRCAVLPSHMHTCRHTYM